MQVCRPELYNMKGTQKLSLFSTEPCAQCSVKRSSRLGQVEPADRHKKCLYYEQTKRVSKKRSALINGLPVFGPGRTFSD